MAAATCVLLLSAVFALAAGTKLASRDAFASVLRHFVPARLVSAMTIAIPIIELALALVLFCGMVPFVACGFAIILFALFTMVLLHMARKRVGGCGCFGESADAVNLIPGIIRNVLLMLAATFALTHARDANPWNRDAKTVIGELTVVLGIICAWATVTALVRVMPKGVLR